MRNNIYEPDHVDFDAEKERVRSFYERNKEEIWTRALQGAILGTGVIVLYRRVKKGGSVTQPDWKPVKADLWKREDGASIITVKTANGQTTNLYRYPKKPVD